MSNFRAQGGWTALGLGALIITLLLGYTFELPIIVNYLRVSYFWAVVLLGGLLLGVGLGRYLLRDKPHLLSFDRYRLLATAALGSALLLPLLVSWSNRLFTPPAQPTPVKFIVEEARYGSRFGNTKDAKVKANTFILFFEWEGELHRITGHEPYFPAAVKGDIVTLMIKKGRWGLDQITK